ncbi:MAG: nucleotide sugar dehydrogenase, partial [Bacteroidia bacterium]|nr:nucleotide sugar dehydrogenase [Bacteroidia bacterium]
MVNVAVIGTGFVGLTHAAVTARFGHNVVAYDISAEKIAAFNSRNKDLIDEIIYEKNLADLVITESLTHRLKFTTNVNDLNNSEVLFMCLPTPYKETGESDLSYLFSAAQQIVNMLIIQKNNSFKLFVNKSTVPIGTAKKLKDFLQSKGLKNFDVASNPEFLPEGDAVEHAIRSSKVVVGAINEESFELLRKVYSSFVSNPNTTYVECNPETAEAIKYVSNTTLYGQIVLWQTIGGRVAEAFPQINFEVLRKGVLADSRIAKWGSYVSAGAGGSCFKKDDLSLAFQLESKGVDSSFIRLLDFINEKQKIYLIDRAQKEANFSFTNKKIAILGTAFKQGTNDMRESNVLAMIPQLLSLNVSEIKLYDPLALTVAKNFFDPSIDSRYKKISYCNSVFESIESTDVAIIATDHQEFRSLSSNFLDILSNKKIRTPYLILDG